MGKLLFLAGGAALSLALTGCVSSKDYQQVKSERDHLRAEVALSQADAQQARSEASGYRQQVGSLAQENQAHEATLLKVSMENQDLHRSLADLNDRYTQAMAEASARQLPAAIKQSLARFASANAELVEFDPSRGLIRFKSDAAFAPGSAELSEKGKAAVAALGAILSSAPVSGYEMMIAGHTDNVRVGRTSTIQAGHRDNWYLSSHRAIAVGRELQQNKVAPNRMAMVGYADQRPVASNANSAGRSLNRRVEVLILSSQVQPQSAPLVSNTSTPTTRPSPQAANQAALNKDDATATTSIGSFLNK